MNILDAQRKCRSALRKGRSKSSKERDDKMRELNILEREFLTEVSECTLMNNQGTHAFIGSNSAMLHQALPTALTSSIHHPSFYPQTPSMGPSTTQTPSMGSPTTYYGLQALSSIAPSSPMPTAYNDGLLRMSLTLNTVLASLLQSTQQHSSMMFQRPTLPPRWGPKHNNLCPQPLAPSPPKLSTLNHVRYVSEQ